uniref:Uncharacterized protein n=1 Tax=Arundo donax TaxID=35708 RepID=A0A0A9A454_ARUDO
MAYLYRCNLAARFCPYTQKDTKGHIMEIVYFK